MSLIKHIRSIPQFMILEGISKGKEKALEDRLFKQYIKNISSDKNFIKDANPVGFYEYISDKAEKLNLSVKDTIEKYMSPTTFSDVLDVILDIDPTDNKQYGNWLVDKLMGKIDSHSFNRILYILREDGGKIKRNLKIFTLLKDRNKLSGNEADINQYDLDELYNAIEPYLGDPEFAGTNKEVIEKESEVIYDNHGWKIVKPQTHRASCAWGSGTNWCTAVDDGDSRTFDQYTENDDLYIFIREKGTGITKFQLHWDDMGVEFRNKRDDMAVYEFQDMVSDELFFEMLGTCVYDMEIQSPVESIEFFYNLDSFCGQLNKVESGAHYQWHSFIPQAGQELIIKILTIQANGKDTLPRYTQSKDILSALIDTNTRDIDGLLDDILTDVGSSIVIDMIESVENEDLLKSLDDIINKHYQNIIQ